MKDLGKNWIIEKSEYYDDYGVIKSTTFYIYQTKIFMYLFYYKSYVKHTECGYMDCSKVKTTFKTVEEADEFIKRVLCPNGPKEEHIYTDVKTINCNQCIK